MTKPSEIKPLGDYDKYIHAMIVADAGFGKTVFGGTSEKALFLTTDPEGTISAKMFGSTAEEWRIESWTEHNKAFAYLRDGGIKELGLNWVIVDNISEAQNLALFETMALARARNKNLDEFVPSQQDYQRSQNMMKVMVKKFHDLPVNILWTSWQAIQEDRDGEIFYAPAIHGQQGSLAQTIAGYMNIVGYGEVVEDGVRRVWFSHAEAFRGKDRFNVLGDFRDRLTVPKMQSLVEGALRKANTSSTTNNTIKKAPAARVGVKPRRK